ncbi:helix-turn-helix transcriptional regulator [Candidatus Halobeggiatoa sp. HSG11]|nr:helix-turn-helix transcriptional regulator [Candidatus Halobeggiatoa sp. HSG11]
MNTQERIGQNIKRLREMSGKTQNEYGQEFDMSRSRICDLESGRFMPNAGIIINVAKYHNVSTDEILMK